MGGTPSRWCYCRKSFTWWFSLFRYGSQSIRAEVSRKTGFTGAGAQKNYLCKLCRLLERHLCVASLKKPCPQAMTLLPFRKGCLCVNITRYRCSLIFEIIHVLLNKKSKFTPLIRGSQRTLYILGSDPHGSLLILILHRRNVWQAGRMVCLGLHGRLGKGVQPWRCMRIMWQTQGCLASVHPSHCCHPLWPGPPIQFSWFDCPTQQFSSSGSAVFADEEQRTVKSCRTSLFYVAVTLQ